MLLLSTSTSGQFTLKKTNNTEFDIILNIIFVIYIILYNINIYCVVCL